MGRRAGRAWRAVRVRGCALARSQHVVRRERLPESQPVAAVASVGLAPDRAERPDRVGREARRRRQQGGEGRAPDRERAQLRGDHPLVRRLAGRHSLRPVCGGNDQEGTVK